MLKLGMSLLVLSFGLAFAQTFPVTVEHKYGSTTVDAAPERIVTLGYNDQDALYAVGAQPIAVRHWFGTDPHDIFPWARAAAGDAAPTVMNTAELDLEAILNFDPDLIVGQFIGLTRAEYDRLSQIAPTVAQSGDYPDYATPWQEMTRNLGASVGRAGAAATAVQTVENAFAEAAAAHPEFAGREVVVMLPNPDGGFWVYSSNDNRARSLIALGFKIPEEIDALAGENTYIDVSEERYDLLDHDLLLILNSDEHPVPNLDDWIATPLFKGLNVAKEGRVLVLEGGPANALIFNTVLSLPYALESILPELQAAVENL